MSNNEFPLRKHCLLVMRDPDETDNIIADVILKLLANSWIRGFVSAGFFHFFHFLIP